MIFYEYMYNLEISRVFDLIEVMNLKLLQETYIFPKSIYIQV